MMSNSSNQSVQAQEEEYEVSDVDESEGLIAAEAVEPRSQEQGNSMIELRRGDDLDKGTAHFIAARGQARLITLAGDVGSGKTTLLISIYERFRQGPFAGYLFAGSETLMGFERRCWRSRIASDAESPETDRTPYGSGRILHLRVRSERRGIGEPCDLLMFDISGEDFKEARTSTAACQRLSELKRTDHFGLLIDGARLIDPSRRQEAIYTGRQLFQRLLDAEMLSSRALVSVIFNKYDLIHQHEEAEDEVGDFLSQTEVDFTETFGKRVAKLRFFNAAPRPREGNWGIAYGIDKVLPLWVEETPFPQTAEAKRPARSVLEREFDAYYERRLPHVFG